jgi:apolipoprotein N-acyltransferase
MFATLLVVAALIYGYWRIYDITKKQDSWPSIRAAVLQGNVPQGEKWAAGGEAGQVKPYADFTKLLMNSGADLIVWPEASYPWIVPEGETRLNPGRIGIGRVGEDKSPFVLLGALTSSGKAARGRRELSNSMLLLDKAGDIQGRYSKTHLVPFGEYVPAGRLLFFAKKLTAPIGNFSPGASLQPMATDSYQIGGLVCYEDIFPEIAAGQAGNGANLLAVITNDAWYGRSSAAFQHLAIAVFRSVENRRWTVRSANTGVSAVVDAAGRIISQTDIFEKGMIVSNVKLGGEMSLYTRLGGWFAWVCVGIGGVLLGMAAGRHIYGHKRT